MNLALANLNLALAKLNLARANSDLAAANLNLALANFDPARANLNLALANLNLARARLNLGSEISRQDDAVRRFARPQSAEKCSEVDLRNHSLDPDAAHFDMAWLEGNMADHNIPSNDSEFHTFQTQFVTTASSNPAKYGMTADDITELKAAQAAWNAGYSTHQQAQEGAHTATQQKESVKSSFIGVIRAKAKKANSTPGVDNAARVSLGLHPYEDTHSPIGAPTTRPLGRIEPSGSCTLIVHFNDETTPHRDAKPHGVQGCQIFLHVGDPAPADPSGYTSLAFDTRTPYTDIHPAADAGKTAYYLLRWQNAKGDVGPWSVVISAKIPF